MDSVSQGTPTPPGKSAHNFDDEQERIYKALVDASYAAQAIGKTIKPHRWNLSRQEIENYRLVFRLSAPECCPGAAYLVGHPYQPDYYQALANTLGVPYDFAEAIIRSYDGNGGDTRGDAVGRRLRQEFP